MVSVYTDPLADPLFLKKSLEAVCIAFPQVTPQFITTLVWRLIDKNFTRQRVEDAVKHVIDTCKYPVPLLADFINFDKLLKIYTYIDVCNAVNIGDSWNNFVFVGRNKYFHRSEMEKYYIEDIAKNDKK